MRSWIVVVAAIVGCVAQYDHALAWGDEGHSIVGEIGGRRLSPQARAGIDVLIGKNASLASFASWADDERSRDRKTFRWHFVDIPLASSEYRADRDCVDDPREGDCIIAAIERESAVVACPTEPSANRARALKFLVHFVGDLHQPLHTVHEERGGNNVVTTIVIRTGANGKDAIDTNLHAAWDAGLIQKIAWSWGSYVERLEADWLPTAGAAVTDGTPTDWAEESHRVAAKIWALTPINGVFDDAYLATVRPTLDRQLAVGGLRLAKLLNDAFAAGRCPGP